MKHWWPPLIVAAILLLLIAAGLFLWTRSLPVVQVAPSPMPTSSAAPSTTALPTQTPSAVEQARDQMSLAEEIGTLLILHTPGTEGVKLQQFVQQYHLGGLILMGDNIPQTVAQLAAMNKQIQAGSGAFPRFIAIDEEGCTVKRLAADTYPCPSELKNQPVGKSFSAFQKRGLLLKQSGINLNFGVVADVSHNPEAFIYQRSFGGETSAVAARVAQAVAGSKESTLITLKHFPGHGETAANSETSIPRIGISKAEWRKRDAPPFQSGIQAGAEVLMFGQLAYTAVDDKPANLSKTWHDIAREELHFQGLMITDDLIMLQESGDLAYQDPVANAVQALLAGNNLLLLVTNHGGRSAIAIDHLIQGLRAAVEKGVLPRSLIDQNVERVLTVRQGL